MAMLSALEADWLEYARSIAACDPTHRAECVQRGGGSAVGPDPELRWPGFIGSDYEANPFRVLCVAQIHNPNGWSASASGLAPMEPLLREWLDGWLTAYRTDLCGAIVVEPGMNVRTPMTLNC